MTSLPDTATPSQPLSAVSGDVVATVGQAAVIINPSKFPDSVAQERFRAEVDDAFASLGWRPCLWLPTTAASRGRAEAVWAVASGASVVVVAGGDGTIRTVAQELAGSGVPMALLPSGTGNLLARNLGIPLHDLRAAVEIASRGRNRPIDLGWLALNPDEDGAAGEEFAFTVMAGAGFDAAIMAGAGHRMKARLGPVAYLLSALPALRRPMTQTTVSADGHRIGLRPSHGFVVGNCGGLTMGLTLLPGADPADGLLDAVVLLPSSISEWARVARSVLRGRRRAEPLLPRLRGRRIDYRSETAQPVEVDGDVIGEARHVAVRVQRAGLIVRSAE